ncbi:hypothetical protein GGR58DRAFT_504704 [Xylaria digitata]|nr:hypothetical protein GGR58DRAFT_504704 [Xylaria digitata]
MPPLTDSLGPAGSAVWDQVVAQLDGTTSVIKIPAAIFYALEKIDELLITRMVSNIVDHPVDFYLDLRCTKRVYLANLASIDIHWPCEANIVPGYPLPVLTPRTIPHPQLMTAPSNNTKQNPNPPLYAPQPLSLSAQPNQREGLKRARISEVSDEGSESGSEYTMGQKKRNKLDPNSPNASTLVRQNGTCASEDLETWDEDTSKTRDIKSQAMQPENRELATPQPRPTISIQLTVLQENQQSG